MSSQTLGRLKIRFGALPSYSSLPETIGKSMRRAYLRQVLDCATMTRVRNPYNLTGNKTYHFRRDVVQVRMVLRYKNKLVHAKDVLLPRYEKSLTELREQHHRELLRFFRSRQSVMRTIEARRAKVVRTMNAVRTWALELGDKLAYGIGLVQEYNEITSTI